MRDLTRTTRIPFRLLGVVLVVALLAVSAGTAFADNGPDYAIPGGWFFTQTGGGQGHGYAVRDSGTDSNGHTIKFWSEFQRLGGVATLGYPVGEPYAGSDGFTYQPFQRGVLQWRPELDQAVLSNTFEILQADNEDAWLLNVKGVPEPITNDGSGGDFQKAVATRLGWLTNNAIKAKYLANPNPSAIASWSEAAAINLYGLPMSQPEQHGPFISQRFQRVTFQLWTGSVPGMPTPGTVVGVLGGDLMKEAGLLPAGAIQVLGPGAAPIQSSAAPTPTPAPAPAPATNYPWHSVGIKGVENCGTTYMTAYTRNASGQGVNGMTLKSWNDYGNVYIASTRNYNGQDGYWDRIVGSGVRPGKWYVMLVDGAGNQASDIVTVNFSASCVPGQGNWNEVEVDFQQS